VILGYDATTLVGRISGVGYYTRRLLQSLSAGVGGDAIERVLVLSNRHVPVPPAGPLQIYEGARFPIRSLWMQLHLPLLLRKLKPDVMHFTNYLAPLVGDTRYVVSFHDMTLLLFPHLHTLKKRLLTASLIPRVARRASLILTPSQASRDDAVRLLGIDPGRVRIIPYAAPDDFRPAAEGPEALAEYGIHPPYLLYVGTLEPRKNLPRALRAFARIAASYPDCRFVLVGQRGWSYDDVLRESARPELRARVLLPGYVAEAHLPLLYTHAAAFVYPSLYEGFGFPVVEAMACGTPVITSRSSSLAEIAEGAALVVDPLDEDALMEAMAAVLADAGLRADLRARGLARVAQYSWEQTARLTVQAYCEAYSEKVVDIRR
jgi:glycosyltransferase involved in cell wall biosynthesis